jgi:hypothetical protein
VGTFVLVPLALLVLPLNPNFAIGSIALEEMSARVAWTPVHAAQPQEASDYGHSIYSRQSTPHATHPGKALTDQYLISLDAIGIPKCNIFVYSHNEPADYFWRAGAG